MDSGEHLNNVNSVEDTKLIAPVVDTQDSADWASTTLSALGPVVEPPQAADKAAKHVEESAKEVEQAEKTQEKETVVQEVEQKVQDAPEQPAATLASSSEENQKDEEPEVPGSFPGSAEASEPVNSTTLTEDVQYIRDIVAETLDHDAQVVKEMTTNAYEVAKGYLPDAAARNDALETAKEYALKTSETVGGYLPESVAAYLPISPNASQAEHSETSEPTPGVAAVASDEPNAHVTETAEVADSVRSLIAVEPAAASDILANAPVAQESDAPAASDSALIAEVVDKEDVPESFSIEANPTLSALPVESIPEATATPSSALDEVVLAENPAISALPVESDAPSSTDSALESSAPVKDVVKDEGSSLAEPAVAEAAPGDTIPVEQQIDPIVAIATPDLLVDNISPAEIDPAVKEDTPYILPTLDAPTENSLPPPIPLLSQNVDPTYQGLSYDDEEPAPSTVADAVAVDGHQEFEAKVEEERPSFMAAYDPAERVREALTEKSAEEEQAQEPVVTRIEEPAKEIFEEKQQEPVKIEEISNKITETNTVHAVAPVSEVVTDNVVEDEEAVPTSSAPVEESAVEEKAAPPVPEVIAETVVEDEQAAPATSEIVDGNVVEHKAEESVPQHVVVAAPEASVEQAGSDEKVEEQIEPQQTVRLIPTAQLEQVQETQSELPVIPTFSAVPKSIPEPPKEEEALPQPPIITKTAPTDEREAHVHIDEAPPVIVIPVVESASVADTHTSTEARSTFASADASTKSLVGTVDNGNQTPGASVFNAFQDGAVPTEEPTKGEPESVPAAATQGPTVESPPTASQEIAIETRADTEQVIAPPPATESTASDAAVLDGRDYSTAGKQSIGEGVPFDLKKPETAKADASESKFNADSGILPNSAQATPGHGPRVSSFKDQDSAARERRTSAAHPGAALAAIKTEGAPAEGNGAEQQPTNGAATAAAQDSSAADTSAKEPPTPVSATKKTGFFHRIKRVLTGKHGDDA